MSDSTPFPAEGAAPQQPSPAVDPLAGDWSEGLGGPVRALGIPEPKPIVLEGGQLPAAPQRPVLEPQPPAPAAETVEAPDAWAAAAEDPLLSEPPTPQSEPPLPSVIANVTGAFHAPSFEADVTPPSAAPSFQPDITPPSPAPSFPPDAAPANAAEFRPGVTPALAVPAPFVPESAEEAAAAAPASSDAESVEGVVELGAEDAAEAHAVPEEEPASPAAGEARMRAAPEEEPASPATGGARMRAAPEDEPVMELSPEDAASPDSPALHTSDAEAWSGAIAGSAPTPWSEFSAPPPVPLSEQVTAIHQIPPPPTPAAASMPPAETLEMASPPSVEVEVVATEDVVWSAPPPAAEPVTEWKAEAPSEEWQEIKRTEPPPAAAAADWSTLSSGPDWSAAAPAEPGADQAWGAPPPTPAADSWSAAPGAPTEGNWSAAPAAPRQEEWAAPAPVAAQSEWAAPASAESDWSAPAPAARSWGGPPAGASTMDQLESETVEASPEAAKELFGSVPAGGSLAGEDELGPPEELDSPEDFLKPVDSDDDPDLLVPVDDDTPQPTQPLAAMRTVNALAVRGEHRVAVHLRRGGTRRGSVKDVDLGTPQFALTPQGGGAAESVFHADVKAIFFMLAPGEKLKAGDGGRVRVTFADGRSIEGVRDGADTPQGFFFVPADAARTNTRCIYVAREALSDVKAL